MIYIYKIPTTVIMAANKMAYELNVKEQLDVKSNLTQKFTGVRLKGYI
jgi:hypothetical protein